jgi:hypothetical protein
VLFLRDQAWQLGEYRVTDIPLLARHTPEFVAPGTTGSGPKGLWRAIASASAAGRGLSSVRVSMKRRGFAKTESVARALWVMLFAMVGGGREVDALRRVGDALLVVADLWRVPPITATRGGAGCVFPLFISTTNPVRAVV